MADNIFASKSKADLIQIVRVSGILPVGQAQRMRKADLANFLNEKMSKDNDPAEETHALSKVRENKVEDSSVSEPRLEEVDPLVETQNSTSEEKTTRKNKRGRRKKSDIKPSEEQDGSTHKETAETRKDNVTSDDTKSKAKEDISSSKTVQSEETIQVDDISARPRASKRSRAKNNQKNTDKTQEESPQEQDSKNNKKKEEHEVLETREGVLELMPDGYGFLRSENYIQGPNDIYISAQLIRRMNLRAGDYIKGSVRNKREQDRYHALSYITEINGLEPDKIGYRPHFDRLTPIYAEERFKLETDKRELSTRIIDLFSPIGKGQRGMIVSPPKAGKTILLQKIANAISINNPAAKLIVLLIDERPEEVTDMQRRINGEVVYSTFDKTPENHVKITELVLERAKRLVEMGQDVVILLDSMTRMARAYNLTITPTGRTLSGGLDPGALHHPKRFFGAARNIENGGSLTIVATALVETGSRMDEVIFEEFKGTGNMEVVLDRKLSEKRIFPAIDINRSSTRREDKLLNEKELEAVWGVRKAFGQLDTSNVTELIINLLLKTHDNEHLIESLNMSLKDQKVLDQIGNSSDRLGSGGNSAGNGGGKYLRHSY